MWHRDNITTMLPPKTCHATTHVRQADRMGGVIVTNSL